MHIDTAGTYTLQYTATDSCGNETIEEREVIVGAKRTVIYTDGTMIINELPKDRANNIALHGAATNEYVPMDEDNPYVFAAKADCLWDARRTAINRVEIGENIAPTSMAQWFVSLKNMREIDGWDRIDTSQITRMNVLFYECERLTSVDVSTWDVSNVTIFQFMFYHCYALQTIDLSSFNTESLSGLALNSMFNGCTNATSIIFGSGFDTSNVTGMSSMFEDCRALPSLDITMFDTRKVTKFSNLFNNCRSIEVLDLSSFSSDGLAASSTSDVGMMFYYCVSLKTILVSNGFDIDLSRAGNTPFREMSTNLVGGAGTVWSAGETAKNYGHIDGGTANPGYFTLKS